MNRFALLLSFALLACAQPKYVDPKSSSGSTQSTQQGQGVGVKLEQLNVQFAWRWETDPLNNAEGIILARFYSPSLVDGFLEPRDLPGDLTLQLWMPEMGHGSVDTMVERVKDAQGAIVPGAYRIKNIYFIMPGKWDLNFQIVTEGAVRDSLTIALVREFR